MTREKWYIVTGTWADGNPIFCGDAPGYTVLQECDSQLEAEDAMPDHEVAGKRGRGCLFVVRADRYDRRTGVKED